MQRISEYSSKEEELSKGQSKNIICLQFLQTQKAEKDSLAHNLKVQHFTVHIQE